ncbi:MAG TPA: hypothetical protein VLS93_13250 [Anaeromyxobacteraceae bacterium]|nr:hypothetical protein [Anaeromyxobacteraceae bacterium]
MPKQGEEPGQGPRLYRELTVTAFEHTAPGGVALFQPDFVAETFVPGTETDQGA